MSDEKSIEQRLAALEAQAHEPFDFTHLVTRLDALEAAPRLRLVHVVEGIRVLPATVDSRPEKLGVYRDEADAKERAAGFQGSWIKPTLVVEAGPIVQEVILGQVLTLAPGSGG